MAKLKLIFGKLVAIFLSAILIACCFVPFQRARENTQEEYRDAYRYTLKAQEYYRALSSAINNLNSFAVGLELNDAFSFFKTSNALFSNDEILHSKLSQTRAALQFIPDPGSRGLVSAINDSFAAYSEYRDLIFSANYSDEDFQTDLRDARSSARKYAKKLKSIVYE